MHASMAYHGVVVGTMVNPFTHRNETNFGPSRHGAGRDRPRARQTSGGGARELSGSGATAHIECSVPRAA
jgi:hypothetical protein